MSAKNFIKLIVIFYFVFGIKQIYLDTKYTGLEVIFFDVGQGDSILVNTPNNKTILIDGGPSYEADYLLYKHNPLIRCNIDVLVLTHPHKDHVNGLLRILDRCGVKLVLHNKVNFNSKAYNDFTEKIKDKNVEHAVIETGSYNLDGVTFTVLWPSNSYIDSQNHDSKIKNPNNLSVVLLIDYKGNEILLTGDAESEVLSKIDISLINDKVEDGLDVYKVPHQGAKDGMNYNFVEALNIKNAVISVGNNSYGHPNPEVINYFEQRKIPIFRTDIDGTIRFRFK